MIPALALIIPFSLGLVFRRMYKAKQKAHEDFQRIADTLRMIYDIDDEAWRDWLRWHWRLATWDDPLQILVHWLNYEERSNASRAWFGQDRSQLPG